MSAIIRVMRQYASDMIVRVDQDEETGIIFVLEMQEALPMKHDQALHLYYALEEYLKLNTDTIEELREEALQEREERLAANRSQPIVKTVDRSGYVYLIEQNGLHKIGITKNLKNRMTAMKTSSGHPIDLIWSMHYPAMDELEHALHVRYESKRTQGEWFNLTPEDVEYIKGLSS